MTDAVVPLWSPSEHDLRESVLARFQQHVGSRHGLATSGYAALWRWSVTQPVAFWGEVWDWFDLPERPSPERVLEGEHAPGGHRWFPGTRLNYAAHVLALGDDDDIAVIGTTEAGRRHVLTRGELREQALAFAATLTGLGVRPGDRVVGYLPNIPEAVVAFLGAAAVGATWSSVGQDYQPSAVADRFGQLEPRVLVAADGYHWGGREVDRLPAVDELAGLLPTIEHTVVVPHLGTSRGAPAPTKTVTWAQATTVPSRDIAPEASSETALPVPRDVRFDHPLWVVYSSGTTGLPKGMVHGHGGILLEMLKLHGLHHDLTETDRFFWYTSPSWIMWNIQTSALAVGASIVCYDGSPMHPTPAALWRVVQDERVTFFGMSPGYLEATENAGLRPGDEFDLSTLRSLASTGSPLPPHLHRWAGDAVGPLPLWSISGGTDVGSGFAVGSPTVPIWPGEISVPALGVALDAWDDVGGPVRGEVGEMVITEPMPSMPIRFWNDHDNERYLESYYAVYPGVWRHGDWITITERGSVIVHGRSDFDPEPQRGAHGERRHLRSRGDHPRGRRGARHRRRAGGRFLLDAALRRARGRPDPRRGACGPDPGRDPRQGLATARSRRDSPGPGRPAHAHGQEAGGPRQAHPPGRADHARSKPGHRRRPGTARPLRRPSDTKVFAKMSHIQ